MKKIILLATVLNLFLHNSFAENKKLHNTIFISNSNSDTAKVFSLRNYPFRYNKYDKSTFKASFNAHFASDTLVSTIAQLKLKEKFSIEKNEYLEMWWKIFVDTSMANKIMGFEFDKNGEVVVFYDSNPVFKNFETATLYNKLRKTHIYPVASGKEGWHTLLVRKRNGASSVSFSLANDKHPDTDNDGNDLTMFRLNKDFSSSISDYIKIEDSFKNIFEYQGFRFFLLSIFILSLSFYFIVEKSKSFLWFSAFSFSIMFIFSRSLVDRVLPYPFPFLLVILFLFLLVFSFTFFIFHTFFGKIPKRIFVYLILLACTAIVSIYLQIYAPNMISFTLIVYLQIILSLLFIILLLENVIKIIYAIRVKKKRIKILAFGILQFLLLDVIIDSPNSDNFNYLRVLSLYLLPTSFLVTLIYLIRDSFTTNISKQAEVISLTKANEKILAEQNEVLEIQVKERTSELVKQKEIIEEKNRNITDNVNYAYRIQAAILPDINLIYKTLEQSFILYMPKDIVSGDFYGFAQKNNQVIIASADCTGHGVSGAFMSMIGSSLLNQIINEKGITKPSEILNHLNAAVIEALKQSDNDSNDGMDIALCSFDLKKMELNYAGAYRPLWLLRNNELQIINADKYPIGGLQLERKESFTNHEIALQKNDTIYIFSDGYADQFGGDTGMKLMQKNFKTILLSIQHLAMRKQELYLKEYFETWRGNYEQVDDVQVIGIRV